MIKAQGAILATALLSVLMAVPSASATNPMAGDWSFALTFSDTQDQEAHNVYLREDGYWKSNDWNVGGNWSRPDALTLNITGQGDGISFSATSVKIAEDYTAAEGQFAYSKDGKWREGTVLMERR